jgi:hypothetical protein
VGLIRIQLVCIPAAGGANGFEEGHNFIAIELAHSLTLRDYEGVGRTQRNTRKPL